MLTFICVCTDKGRIQHVTTDGSSDLVKEQVDEDKEEGLKDNAIRGSTMSTRRTSTTGSVTSVANSLCGNLSREKWPCLVLWKFFIALQVRKSVHCQLCPVGNNDGFLVYHGVTSSMYERLKRRHYTAFWATTSDTSDMSSTSEQARLDSFTHNLVCSQTCSKAIADCVAGVIIKVLRPINFVDWSFAEVAVAN